MPTSLSLSPSHTRRLYFAVCLLIAILVLLGLAYAGYHVWNHPYTGISWDRSGTLVVEIDPASPAAQAGIQPGDRILKVDGLPLPERASSHWRAGERVTLTTQRGTHIFTTSLVLAPPPTWQRIQSIIPLAVAFVFWLVATLIWLFHPTHPVTQLFFLTSQVAAALLSVGSLTAHGMRQWGVIFRLLLIGIAPLTLHFFTQFPRPISPLRRRYILLLAYGGAFVLLGASTITSLVLGTRIPALLTRFYVAVTILVGLSILFRSHQDTLRTRRRRRLLIMGMLIGILPLLTLSFIPEMWRGAPWLDYAWTFPFLALIPITYAYALRSGELGTADWILSRTLVHLILTGLFLGIYVLLFLRLDSLVPALAPTFPILVAVLAVVAAALFVPARHLLLRWADRFLYGGWYDYRETLQKMSRALNSVIQEEDLAHLLVHHLSKILHLRGAALYLTKGQRLLTPIATTGTLQTSLLPSLPVDGHVALFLKRQAGPVTPIQVQKLLSHLTLTAEERAWVQSDDLALWLPLVYRGEMRGVLLLGKQASGDPFEADDIRLLGTLATQAATAAENIRLIQALRTRIEEVESLYVRLGEVREEERKYLARELHDTVLQDIIQSYLMLVDAPSKTGISLEERVNSVAEHLHQIIHTIRHLCRELRPPALDILDLRSAIEGHINEVRNNVNGLDISVTFDPDNYDAFLELPDEIAITLFRSLQEALANVLRHAEAQHVWVHVMRQEDVIHLLVQDDGRGFDVPYRLGVFVQKGHYGLAGLAERVAAYGGTLEVHSFPGEGTLIKVQMPTTHRGG